MLSQAGSADSIGLREAAQPTVPRNASRLFSSSVLLSSHSATSPGDRVILQPENFSIKGADTKGQGGDTEAPSPSLWGLHT